ncbi:MAG: hypothetical protein K2K95_04125, partial [Muribaculaceae bacterium]|nr:hypothetical protein [Muribaculaceae bacterium]
MRRLHRFTGVVIAIFFIMWFITGIILLYHGYPRVTDTDRYTHMRRIDPEGLPDLYDIPGLSDSVAVSTLSVDNRLGETVWTLSNISRHTATPMEAKPETGGKFVIAGDSLISPKSITNEVLDSIACEWAGSENIRKVDTLHRRQQ